MAMTTRADTDDHIPEQLSLAGQDQVQVSITLPSPPGSLTKNLSQGSRLLALCCFTWPVSARGVIVPLGTCSMTWRLPWVAVRGLLMLAIPDVVV